MEVRREATKLGVEVCHGAGLRYHSGMGRLTIVVLAVGLALCRAEAYAEEGETNAASSEKDDEAARSAHPVKMRQQPSAEGGSSEPGAQNGGAGTLAGGIVATTLGAGGIIAIFAVATTYSGLSAEFFVACSVAVVPATLLAIGIPTIVAGAKKMRRESEDERGLMVSPVVTPQTVGLQATFTF